MLSNLTDALAFPSQALVLRAERQRLIASNIANADTPGYVARDFNFRQVMEQALVRSTDVSVSKSIHSHVQNGTHPKHLNLQSRVSDIGQRLAYAPVTQPSMDSNTVDLDRERSNFTDNAIRYESTLRFINGYSKTILSAIQGQ